MKQLLQTLFFFLLVTQICFAQFYPQTSKINLNEKSGMTDRMDKHHRLIGSNIHSGKYNEFSKPNFNDKLPIETSPFEVNNTSYPFQNERLIPDVLQKDSPSIIRMLSSQSQFYVIDTAIVLSTSDTVRHLYTFNPNAKRTSDLTQTLNGDTWVDSLRLTNVYDVANNMLSELYESWQSVQWVNSYRITYTYDAQGNMLTDFYETWENGQWVNYYRDTYTYDAQGNMLSYLYENWENGQWVNYYRITYTYDAQGNRLSELYENWENGQWVNSGRLTYTYDAQGNMLTDLLEDWENGQWVNSYRRTYTYDTQGNKLYEFYEYWENGQWVNQYRFTFTYDAQGNKLSQLLESWENGQWVNYGRGTYTYDAQGNMLSSLHENWENSQWVNSYRRIYTFDVQGNLTSIWNYIWQNSTWTPTNYGTRGEFSVVDNAGNYYYLGLGYNFTLSYNMIVTGVESASGNVPGTYTLSQNYPNPFNPSTKISWQSPVSSWQTLKVFDVLGNEVVTLVNEYIPAGSFEVEFSARGGSAIGRQASSGIGNLASGIYFYQLKAGSFIETKKMILLR